MSPPLVTGPPPLYERGTGTEHTYHGSCHCENVKFKLVAPAPDEIVVTTCTCTYCSKRGTVNIHLKDPSLFEWTKGSWDDLTVYRFNSEQCLHHFCPKCGITVGSRAGPIIVVNMRCIVGEPALDFDEVKRRHYDGLNMLPNVKKAQDASAS